MENLTPTTSTASLDVATEIDAPFKDAPAAPETPSEESPLPAGGLPDPAEAADDGAIVMPDEAAHSAPSEIEDDTPDDQDLPPRFDDAAAPSAAAEDMTFGAADERLPGAPDPSDEAAAGGLATPTKPSARKRGRPPKKRVLPDLPQRASDPTVVEDCIAKLMKLNGRDLHTDMERGHVLNTLQASCADGAEFAKVVRKRARLSGKQALNLINLTARFGDQVDRWAALGVTSTHLRHLVTKPDEYVEECYAAFSAKGGSVDRGLLQESHG